MKIKIYLVLFMITVLFCSVQLTGSVLSISGSATLFNSADNNYKSLYGKNGLLPEFKMTINLSKNIYVWGSYSMGTFTGETIQLKEPMTCSRSFLNFGLGLSINIIKPIMLFVDGGGAYANFEEDSFGVTYKGSKMGFVITGGIRLNILKSLFIHIKGGYIAADSSINDIDIKLGGVIIGGGLGISF